ncbi:MAG: succinate dehydrogenase assembly factor 2 [Alphaproteobacteria bacterium]|nr:succinate dehydrogenase assembly factor 2 [Alphaproteobacteria bacterium]
MSNETLEIRLKRLRMRSWRRGTKEMDLILGPFADDGIARLSSGELDVYEQLLDENDHDLYRWFSEQVAAPPEFVALVAIISADLPSF